MKKYIFNIVISLLFFGCPLDGGIKPKVNGMTPDDPSAYSPKYQEKRPYNFKVKMKFNSEKIKEENIDLSEYTDKNGTECIRIQEKRNGEIDLDWLNECSDNVNLGGGFTVKDEINNFKKAMFKGGKLKIRYDSGGDGNNDKDGTLTIKTADYQNKKYIVFDHPNENQNYSFAIKVEDLKKHIVLD